MMQSAPRKSLGARGPGALLAWAVVALCACLLGACGGAAYAEGGASPASYDRSAGGVATASEAPTADAEYAAPEEAELYRAPGRNEVSEPQPIAQSTPARPAQPAPPVATGGQATDTPPPAPGVPQDPPPVGTGTEGAGPKAVASPLLIYTANVTMAVFETKKTLDDAEKLAKGMGGYLVRRDDRSITFRVPSGKFDGALEQVMKLGDVLGREVSVKDVTEEYFDLKVRVRNLEVVRERLEALLLKATKVDEALAVERELERVAGNIERIKGRLKLLQELVAFSTITLTLQPRPVDRVGTTVRMPFDWLGGLGLGSLLNL